jgi:hypothetical protein
MARHLYIIYLLARKPVSGMQPFQVGIMNSLEFGLYEVLSEELSPSRPSR